MIKGERVSAYINSLDTGNTPFLEELEKEARAASIPIIRREMQSFLKVLLALKAPERILEIGAAIGFSALFFCEYGPKDCQVTTIENYEKRWPIALQNFQKGGRAEQITLLQGDAGQILPTLAGPYDLIFLDAAKGQYLHFLPDILRLMTPGSVLLSDNVLQEGDILESRFLVERRNRTIHRRMREYLYALKHTDALITAVLPLGDGITLSTMTERKEGETL